MTFADLTLEQVLDDLSSRFIINIPDEELSSIERICFQIEQAHWFYEDFVREENAALPSFSLKSFCGIFFRHCPLLHEWVESHEQAFDHFLQYKFRVPVCGAIILNDAYDHVLLVKGWSSKTWSWPRGKINKGELELKCAVREVEEETGFDISPYLCRTAHPPTPKDHPDEPDFIELTIKEQRLRLYIAAGVPSDALFMTRTRKEIAAIQWHPITDLPGYARSPADAITAAAATATATAAMAAALSHSRNTGNAASVGGAAAAKKYFMLVPFVGALRTWLKRERKSRNNNKARHTQHSGKDRRARSPQAVAVASKTAASELKSLLGIGSGTAASPRDPSRGRTAADVVQGVRVRSTSPQPATDALKSMLGIGIADAGSHHHHPQHHSYPLQYPASAPPPPMYPNMHPAPAFAMHSPPTMYNNGGYAPPGAVYPGHMYISSPHQQQAAAAYHPALNGGPAMSSPPLSASTRPALVQQQLPSPPQVVSSPRGLLTTVPTAVAIPIAKSKSAAASSVTGGAPSSRTLLDAIHFGTPAVPTASSPPRATAAVSQRQSPKPSSATRSPTAAARAAATRPGSAAALLAVLHSAPVAAAPSTTMAGSDSDEGSSDSNSTTATEGESLALAWTSPSPVTAAAAAAAAAAALAPAWTSFKFDRAPIVACFE